MEGLGGKAAYHFHSPSGGPGSAVNGDYTGWHIFAGLWEPGSVTFYYDNVEVGKITTGITGAPQYLILNNGIGGYVGATLVPSGMQVDWVQVRPPRRSRSPQRPATPAPAARARPSPRAAAL